MFLPIVSVAAPFAIIESAASEDMQILQSKGLSSIEGRIAFLENDLPPFIANIERLNDELQRLSREIASLDLNDPEGQNKIVHMGTQLNEKVDLLAGLLPVLESALSIESDFACLELIFEKREPLDPSEEKVVQRVASLCRTLNSFGY